MSKRTLTSKIAAACLLIPLTAFVPKAYSQGADTPNGADRNMAISSRSAGAPSGTVPPDDAYAAPLSTGAGERAATTVTDDIGMGFFIAATLAIVGGVIVKLSRARTRSAS